MPPKNIVRSAGMLPGGMVTIRAAGKGGFATLVEIRLVGVILGLAACGRCHGSAGGSRKGTRYANWFCKAGTTNPQCVA